MDYLVKIRSVQTPLNGQFSIGANTYYYLGRAAEGLNYLPAAKTYYQLGLSAQAKCKVMGISNCQGHDLPDDINKHLAKLDGK